jgi:hypothetical protein
MAVTRMDNVEAIRGFSRAAFGNRHRLEVLAAIGKAEREFYVQELSRATGIPSSTISPIIRELGAELVRPLGRLAGNAPHYHQRVDHPVWPVAVNLLSELRRQESQDESPVGAS